MKRENYKRMILKWASYLMLIVSQAATMQLQAQCNGSPACGADTYGLSESCRDSITAEHLLTNYDPSCTYTVVLMRNGLPVAPIVTGADVGRSFMYMVNVQGGGGCSGVILIEDKRPPVVTCPQGPVVVPCGFAPGGLPRPSGLEDCSAPLNITGPFLSVNNQNNACDEPLLRVLTATWNVFDRYNNVTTCSYQVQVIQANPANVQAPADTTLTCGPNLNLTPAALGVPTIDGMPFSQGNGFCNLMLSDPSDKVSTVCGNARVITRTWQIMNMCNPLAPPVVIAQTINIIDLQAPVVSLPVNQIQVNALTNQCVSGIVTLPAASITEQCSPGSVTVFINTPAGVVNGNGGSIAGVAVGTHVITYMVSDPCGNTTSATLSLVVSDNTPPNAICRTFTTIPLTNLGQATAPAHVFNNGSFDNCGPVFFKVARMSGNDCNPNPQYDDQVHFCCSDIPENNITIILRVYDVNPGAGPVDPNAFAGRFNSCMIEVEVQDKLRPTVTCPGDITVDCLTDLSYYLTNEIPLSVDNCGENLTGVAVLDSTNFNVACKTGYVTRTITYSDMQNQIVCQQRITLDNISMPGGVVIQWPENFMGQSCGRSVHPDSLPAVNGRPVVTASLCGASIGVGYEDLVFQIVEDACFKVVRTWSVMNWCTYNPSTGEGLWTHHQIIKVLDDENPIVTAPADTVVFVPILDNNCGQVTTLVETDDVEAVDCTPESDLRYRYQIDFNADGTYDTPLLVGKNASRVYPVGTHRVRYLVDDLCGNTAVAFQTIEVAIEDRKEPTPVMKELHTALMPGSNPPMVNINAALFNSGSYDNCTPFGLLRYAYSTNPNDTVRTFFCEDAPLDTVQIYVFDQAGNYDFVSVRIHIRDDGLCPDSLMQGGLVQGKIVNEFNTEIESVRVELQNSAKAPVVTGADGKYSFDRVQRNQYYRLAPAKNTDPRNGISTIDILLIQRHILGMEPLNSPYKLLAADVNRNGQITASDLVEMQRLILGKTQTLANQESWMFVDAEYVFPDPMDPFSFPIPQQVDLLQLPMSLERNFIGVKMGDVNNTASMNSLVQNAGSRNGQKALELVIEDKNVKEGEYLYIPMTTRQFHTLDGFQATIQYHSDKLQFTGMQAGMLPSFGEQNYYHLNEREGIINFNWYQAEGARLEAGEPVFFTRWMVKSDAVLSEILSINSAGIDNEVYFSDASTGRMQLVFEGKTKNQQTTRLLQNKPNPFSQETIISFELAEKSEATLTVMDLSGKVLWQQKGLYDRGMHDLRLHKNTFGTEGVYLYRLDTDNYTETKRMILVNN